jgi:hypothetical protein
MSLEWKVADEALSQRLIDQHDVVIDALGGSLLSFPFDLSQEGLKILESGCADGKCIHPHVAHGLTFERRTLVESDQREITKPEFEYVHRNRHQHKVLSY